MYEENIRLKQCKYSIERRYYLAVLNVKVRPGLFGEDLDKDVTRENKNKCKTWGAGPQMKATAMLVVSLEGRKYRIWSDLRPVF